MAKIFDFNPNKGLIDTVSGTALTNSGVTFKNTDKGVAGYFIGTTKTITTSLSLSGITKASFSINLKGLRNNQNAFFEHFVNGNNFVAFYQYNSTLAFIINSGGTLSFGVFNNTTRGNNNYVVLYDGSGATNSDRLKIYKNGINNTLSFTGTIPSSFPALTGTMKIGFYSNAGLSSTDYILGLKIYNNILTQTDINNEYKQLLSLKPQQPPKTNLVYPRSIQLRETGLIGARNMVMSKG